jgi:two-component system, NarL family, response regulator
MSTMAVPGKIRVLLADDHPVVRLGLRSLVNSQLDMAVVAETADGPGAARNYCEHRPDVTLMDLRMPGGDGPEAISAIRRLHPAARILVLTTYDGDEDAYRAIAAGAVGYLLKDTFPEGILEAIRNAHTGADLLPEGMAARLREGRSATGITPREREVLELVARGFSNREIQLALGMAEGTLKNHLKHIFDKLGAADRTEAALLAVKRGVIRP